MAKRLKDPGKLSRLVQAVAISMLISGSVGGLYLFGWYKGAEESPYVSASAAVAVAATVICIFFWMAFIPLYLILVRRSAGRLELERFRAIEEKTRVERTKQALSADAKPDPAAPPRNEP